MEYRLITAVSGFPCLYDRSSPTYRDLNMRSDAWREVSQLVGVNGERLRGSAARSPAGGFRPFWRNIKAESECLNVSHALISTTVVFGSAMTRFKSE